MIELLEPFFKNRTPDAFEKKAWAEWLKRGFPNKKWEAYRYVSLQKLQKISNLIDASCHFDYQLPSGIVILPLCAAKRFYGPLLEKRYAQLSQTEKDPFFFLNYALSNAGLFIYVPPGVSIEEPLSLTQIVSASNSPLSVHPRLEIFLAKGASLTVITSIDCEGKSFWNNSAIHVTVEEGARYTHYDHAKGHLDAWDFLTVRAQLMKKSSFKFFSFGRGALVQRRDLAVALNGESAEAELRGVTLLDQQLEGHVHIRIDHCAFETRSHQFFKHVVADRSRSSFEGKIFVEKQAQKTQAYQLNNNLILSDKAAAFSKPNLEIFADDVTASHGATISKLCLDELFYLQSRGLSQSQAQDHLVRGFCRELIRDVSLPSLYDQFSGEIDAYLSHK